MKKKQVVSWVVRLGSVGLVAVLAGNFAASGAAGTGAPDTSNNSSSDNTGGDVSSQPVQPPDSGSSVDPSSGSGSQESSAQNGSGIFNGNGGNSDGSTFTPHSRTRAS